MRSSTCSPLLALTAVFCLSSCATAAPVSNTAAPVTSATPVQAQSTPTPGTAVSLDATEKAEYPLAPEEKKPLIAKFKKALSDEERALDKEEATATRQFKTAQSQQVKDWRNQERTARRAYFDAHLSGPDRREYVQSYITRKKDFDQRQKDDFASFKLAQKEKRDVLKANQKSRDQQFKASVDRNVRPSKSLWTSGS